MKPLLTKWLDTTNLNPEYDPKDLEEPSKFLGTHFPEVMLGFEEDIVFQS